MAFYNMCDKYTFKMFDVDGNSYANTTYFGDSINDILRYLQEVVDNELSSFNDDCDECEALDPLNVRSLDWRYNAFEGVLHASTSGVLPYTCQFTIFKA